MSAYVDSADLYADPARYNKHFIQSTATLASGPYYSPTRGGPKYVLDLESPSETQVKITVWRIVPEWIPYTSTSPMLWALFDSQDPEERAFKRLFVPGKEVFFEGYVIQQGQTTWINVERILLPAPSVPVGPREIISVQTCPRKYYLDYVKNVKRSILKYPNKYITRGNLVHHILAAMLCDGTYCLLSNQSQAEREHVLRERIDDAIQTEFRLDAALHLIAGVSLESIKKDVFHHLATTLYRDELSSFTSGKKVRSEVQVNNAYGLGGIADLLVDSCPVEMKTSWNVRPEHTMQLLVYLFASYLDSGNRTGFLLYTQPTPFDEQDGDPCHLHEITLSDSDIDQIIKARNKVLLLREGMQLPTTHSKWCSECPHQRPPGHALSKNLPPCQYYCQTERFWDCYESDETGTVSSRCLLVDACPTKLMYFDVNEIDHYNKLRSAITAEHSLLSAYGSLLRVLPEEQLVLAGQQAGDLRLSRYEKGILHLNSASALPHLDVSPGDYALLRTTDGVYSYRVVVHAIGLTTIELATLASLPDEFLNSERYTLVKDYAEIAIFRRLLGVIDFIQRSQNVVKLSYQKGSLLPEHHVPRYDKERVIAALERAQVIAIQMPAHLSEVACAVDLVASLQTGKRILVILRNSREVEEFVQNFRKRHLSLVINKEAGFTEEPRPWEIGNQQTVEEIEERIHLSPIILTDRNFLLQSRVFELLRDPDKRRYFDFVLADGAEQLFEPLNHYIQSFAEQSILIGDANRVTFPLKSLEARNAGLGVSTLEKLIRFDAFFESREYAVFSEHFPYLPGQITEALRQARTRVDADADGGAVCFMAVHGHEDSGSEIYAQYTIAMKPVTTEYLLSLEPKTEIDLNHLEIAINQLSGKQIRDYPVGSAVPAKSGTLTVKRSEPIGPAVGINENVMVSVTIPAHFLEGLQDLMFVNQAEAERVVDVVSALQDRESCAVLTPYISQASLIRLLLVEHGITDVPVWLPHQVSGHSYTTVIVSFVSANAERVLRWPLTDPKVLYTLLTAARGHLILIGEPNTLSQSRILRDIISSQKTVQSGGTSN